MKSVPMAEGSRPLLLAALATTALAAPLALAAPGRAAAAPPGAATSLDGVWKITRIVRTGADAGTIANPQPGLAIYYRGYFSIVRDNAAAPRQAASPPKDPSALTEAEKAARYDEWAPFAASSGTYEIKGDTIITHNVLAKQVKGVGLTEEATIRFEGPDTYVATAKSPPGMPPGERQTTYTRIR